MANTKLSQLSANTSPSLSDYMVSIEASGPTDVKVTLQNLLTLIADNVAVALSNPYKFCAYRAGAWTSSNAAYVTVNMDTISFDTNNNYNTTSGAYTVPINGFYWFGSTISVQTVTTGQAIGVAMYVAANPVVQSIAVQGDTAGFGKNVTVSCFAQCTAGQAVTVSCYGNSTAGATGLDNTFFSGFLVSAT